LARNSFNIEPPIQAAPKRETSPAELAEKISDFGFQNACGAVVSYRLPVVSVFFGVNGVVCEG
jgi:hypothetical protein